MKAGGPLRFVSRSRRAGRRPDTRDKLGASLRLTERVSADLSFEAFNILNHANFGSQMPTVGNSLFGLSTQMLNQGLGGLNALYQIGGPRSLPIGAKLRC